MSCVPSLTEVLASAAHLQELVPDAVLVGGAESPYYAGHRESFDLTLLGSLDGIEAGLRQLRRSRPLEVQEVTLPGGERLRVPTVAEILRIKAYLVVQRNQVRDDLDTVALAGRIGPDEAVNVLAGIDDYYADRSGGNDSVLTAVAQRLSDPHPRDERVTGELAAYNRLDERWHDWATVVRAAQDLADGIVEELERRR